MRKKVSVIITCYNYGKYLDKALDSVLNSLYDNFEIILVDDGSTDIYTIKKIDEIENKNISNLKIIRQNNFGVSMARNNGFSKSTGDYIIFLDADDIIDNKYIGECADILDKNDYISFVYTSSIFFNDKKKKKIFNLEYNLYSLLFRNYIPITSMIRREAIERVNGYKKCGYEDWEFYINLGENGFYGYYLKEYLFFYRIHKDNKQNKDDINRENNIGEIKDIHSDLYNPKNLYLMKRKLYKNNLNFLFKELIRLIRAIVINFRVWSLK